MVWGCTQWGPVLLANESKKESESSTKNHNVVILSGFCVLNFVIIVNIFGTVLVVCGEKRMFSYNLVFVLIFDVLNPTVFIFIFYYIYFYMDDQICDF